MAEINLQFTDTESLASLTERQQQGFSVVRSAHIGNAGAYNLALADAGVPMLFVDHNVTGIDESYFPGFVVRGGDMRAIAEPDQLSFRARTLDGNAEEFVDELHLASMQSEFPNTPMQTNTEYLRRNESIVGEIAMLALRMEPQLFQRVVQADEPGAVKSPTEAQRLMEQGRIIQLADDPRREQGVLPPNEVDILANFVIELIASGRDEQYHVSGPDMVLYMTRPKSKDELRTPLQIINRLYNELLSTSSFKAQLPDEITVNLVPGAAMKFATTAARSADLDILLASIERTKDELKAINNRRGDFFKTTDSRDDEKKGKFVAFSNKERQDVAARMKQRNDQCFRPFMGQRETPLMSQYDVGDEGGLHVPEPIRTASMAELSALDREIQELQRGAP